MSPLGTYFTEIIFSLRGDFPTGLKIFLYLLKTSGKVDFENLVRKFIIGLYIIIMSSGMQLYWSWRPRAALVTNQEHGERQAYGWMRSP